MDKYLLPEGGITKVIGKARAGGVEKRIPGVRVGNTGRVIVSKANLVRWINEMGTLLCETVKTLEDGNQSCEVQTSMGMECLAIISIIREVFSADEFLPIFVASSLAPVLASCYTQIQSIGRVLKFFDLPCELTFPLQTLTTPQHTSHIPFPYAYIPSSSTT